jgi:hypothetical protein
VRGFLAFLTVACVAQVIAFAMGLVRGGLATATIAKLGWLYALAFHRVPIEIGGSAFAGYRVSVAFLTGTAFALWVVYRHGRAVGRRLGGSGWRAALAGAAVAPTYAIPFALLTLVVHLELGAGSPLLGPAGIHVEGVALPALVLPLGLAAGAGAAGGLMSGLPPGSWVKGAMVGGWRMFSVALGLALVGLLLLAAVRPAGLAAYARVILGNGPGTDALLLGHQALLLPNQALFVLAPSMGGCVGLHGPTYSYPIVCPGHLPRLDRLILPAPANASVALPSLLSRSMPLPYALFLVVPLAATIWTGRAIRSLASDPHMLIRIVIVAGVLFAVCTGIGSWFAGVTLPSASSPRSSSVTLGARLLPTALIALAWGIGGGLIGGLSARRQDALDPAEPPPSPTSV